jgi:hypothetical protein
MKYNRLVRKLRERIYDFSGRLSAHFSIPKGRFIGEMLYGILARQTVLLSEIARSLEEPIPLIKTENRLSRNLDMEGMEEQLLDSVLELGRRRVHRDTLLVLDLSDIRKRYARRMEYLSRVWDGSTGEVADGYWLCHVTACDRAGRRVVPLYQSLYSADAPEQTSENNEILRAVNRVRGHVKERGIWVLDRGGDRVKLFRAFLNRGMRFIVRQRRDRHLVFRGRRRSVLEIAEGCPLLYAETVVAMDGEKEKAYTIEFGYRKVKLPGREESLYLVVVRGFGREPLMLLTPLVMRRNREVLWSVVEGYLARWRIEETIRFIKQSYRLEDIRVMTYRRLKNLVALVLAACYFAAVYLGEGLKLKILARRVLKLAKRFFGVPDFHYYALADGIATILAHATVGPIGGHGKPPPGRPEPQLSLFRW